MANVFRSFDDSKLIEEITRRGWVDIKQQAEVELEVDYDSFRPTADVKMTLTWRIPSEEADEMVKAAF